MYRLKQIIEEVGEDRKINNDLQVKDGKVYLTHNNIEYIYQDGNYYQKCDGFLVNLQGGVPDYECDEFDEKLFEVEE